MLLRRTALTLIAAAWVAPAIPAALAQGARPSPSQAEDFIRNVGNQLIGIVNGPGSGAQKSAALTQIIDSDVAVTDIARFCLGRFWRLASPQQQQEYEALFHRVLVSSITSKIGEYQGVRFTIGRATVRPEGTVIASTIAGPNKPPAEVDWVVNDFNGSPKIVDMIAEGTSLRLTQRDDYASFIVQHNNSVQALVDALRRQASANG